MGSEPGPSPDGERPGFALPGPAQRDDVRSFGAPDPAGRCAPIQVKPAAVCVLERRAVAVVGARLTGWVDAGQPVIGPTSRSTSMTGERTSRQGPPLLTDHATASANHSAASAAGVRWSYANGRSTSRNARARTWRS